MTETATETSGLKEIMTCFLPPGCILTFKIGFMVNMLVTILYFYNKLGIYDRHRNWKDNTRYKKTHA